jgi:hypothetical protein
MADNSDVSELVDGAQAIGALAQDEDHLRAAFDAFRASDRDSFQRLLTEFGLSERCELVCDWICSKECVLLCLELCGPPIEVELPDLREFGEVIVRITGDEELVERLAETVSARDAAGFRALVTELQIERFCHLFCHWVCAIRCRLLREVVCSPVPGPVRYLAEELGAAGQVVASVIADREVLAEVEKAVLAGNCDLVREAVARLRLFDHCQIVCEWLCGWRCVRVCLLLCRAFPFEHVDLSLTEAFEFAKVTTRLAAQPESLQRLSAAVEAQDPKAFEAVVNELELGRFCIQLCHWICSWHCHRFCRCVCPPRLQPWFTQVGHFDIYADIDPSTGLTNKGLSYSGLYFNGGPDFAFHGCLELRGFCPAASPIDGTPMKYRFVLAGSGLELTGGRVCPVDAGTRRILWPANASGIASAVQVLTFQSISIEGAPVADTPPPAPGDPWVGPTKHVITPDADGWITVDPAHVAGGFTTLVGFNSADVVPGGTPPSPPPLAGTPVATVDQKNGADLGITFEATRISLPPGPPDFTNALGKIHINNWAEVNLLDITEFHTGGGTACTGITTDLHVEYTTDHELMKEWDAVITSAALTLPVTVASGPTVPLPRGDGAIQAVSTAGFKPCSYVVTLSTRAGLTDGLIDNVGRSQQKTFCVK